MRRRHGSHGESSVERSRVFLPCSRSGRRCSLQDVLTARSAISRRSAREIRASAGRATVLGLIGNLKQQPEHTGCDGTRHSGGKDDDQENDTEHQRADNDDSPG